MPPVLDWPWLLVLLHAGPVRVPARHAAFCADDWPWFMALFALLAALPLAVPVWPVPPVAD